MGSTVQPINAKATVRDHIHELRSRFIVCILVYILVGVALFFVYEPILKVLSSTLGSELYYSDPAGGFSFIMKICATGALVFTIPVILFNIIKFIKPAFEKILTNKRVLLISVISTFLATSGALFAFYVILPETINFFTEFQVGGLSALINADQYLSFVTGMIAVFAIIFQVPLIMLLVDSIKNITPKDMFKMEKWVVVISIVVAIITPFNYDILSSLVVAVPIIGLYNLSILMVFVKHKFQSNKSNQIAKAVIIKPKVQADFEIKFENLAEFGDELVIIDKHYKNYQKSLIESPVTANTIDFKHQNININEVKPAAWVEERKQRILDLNNNVKVFSDVIPKQSRRIMIS